MSEPTCLCQFSFEKCRSVLVFVLNYSPEHRIWNSREGHDEQLFEFRSVNVFAPKTMCSIRAGLRMPAPTLRIYAQLT